MIIKLAEYTIKMDALEKVLTAIEKFVAEIHKNEPNTFYEAFRRDSCEFVHLMKFPDSDDEKKHASASYTIEFVSILYPNCLKEPVFTDLTIVE